MKVSNLTTGGLTDALKLTYEKRSKKVYREKSAEAIVVVCNEPWKKKKKNMEVSHNSEGLNFEK